MSHDTSADTGAHPAPSSPPIPEYTLHGWRDDPDAVFIKCHCGKRGGVMSRTWNYDAAARCWEPQCGHLPTCEHFEALRDVQKTRNCLPLPNKKTDS